MQNDRGQQNNEQRQLNVLGMKTLLRQQQQIRPSQSHIQTHDPEPILILGNLRMDTTTQTVTRAERTIDLTTTEYNLLHLFMSHPHQILRRPAILRHVWGYDFQGETNIIEVYIRYLREKIEDTPSTPRMLITVRGVGYVLQE
jgi:two-component system, OmpR family, response regulator MprA